MIAKQASLERYSYVLSDKECVVIVASRVNSDIVDGLIREARSTLTSLGVAGKQVALFRVPGAFEIPFAVSQVARKSAAQRKIVAIVALGCVIEGKTEHFRLIVEACSQNLQLLGLQTGIPVGFGVLAVKEREDAVKRMAYARQAVLSALAMRDFIKTEVAKF